MTRGPAVGSVFSHFFDDLYEQCSFHMAEKMPSSVNVGSRPIRSRIRWYSSGFSPCEATSSGVIGRVSGFVMGSGASLARGAAFGHSLTYVVRSRDRKIAQIDKAPACP